MGERAPEESIRERIRALRAKMGPQANALVDEYEEAMEAHLGGEGGPLRDAVPRLRSRLLEVPERDRQSAILALDLLMDLKEAEREPTLEELEAAREKIDKAVALERAAGREIDPEKIAVFEAMEILERHGEGEG